MFVFLSYSRADSDLVMRLKNDLQGHGVQAWIDREGLQPGTLDWEEALRTAIRAAQAVRDIKGQIAFITSLFGVVV